MQSPTLTGLLGKPNIQVEKFIKEVWSIEVSFTMERLLFCYIPQNLKDENIREFYVKGLHITHLIVKKHSLRHTLQLQVPKFGEIINTNTF